MTGIIHGVVAHRVYLNIKIILSNFQLGATVINSYFTELVFGLQVKCYAVSGIFENEINKRRQTRI